jgi:L-fuculokinase
MESCVAVIDIGMTNKKVAVYDSSLRVAASRSRTFEPIMIDGLPTHDLAGMEEWFLDQLGCVAREFLIRAIAVTAHGATFVCVGPDGKPCAPCVLYTYEPGQAFQRRFYDLAGDPGELQAVTGTPVFSAMINAGKGLFFLRERFPEEFARTESVLALPQYWGLRLTGKAGAEGTYIANHTYLWDWVRDRYSFVAGALGVAGKLPPRLLRPWDTLGHITPEVAKATGLSPDTVVTLGIHDSNASLLPHLAASGERDFVLNSTGTWCVLMHPQESYGFEPGEIGKVVFFNRSAYRKPVKTAIFLGGQEYEAWSGLIAKTAGAAAGDSDPAAYRELFKAGSAFILPEIVPGSGQFPGSRARAVEDGKAYSFQDIDSGRAVPAFLRNPRVAMAALNASLAIQTQVALGRAGLKPGAGVYTEGGFRKNAGYNALVASALPDNPVSLTDICEATSFGAAMTAVAALEGVEPGDLGERFKVDYRSVAPLPEADVFPAYRDAWMGLVNAL